jgi:hypothetical protein
VCVRRQLLVKNGCWKVQKTHMQWSRFLLYNRLFISFPEARVQKQHCSAVLPNSATGCCGVTGDISKSAGMDPIGCPCSQHAMSVHAHARETVDACTVRMRHTRSVLAEQGGQGMTCCHNAREQGNHRGLQIC